MSEYAIDTQKALGAVHEAYDRVLKTPDPSVERERWAAYANAALSATMVYVRKRNPPVQKKHFDAVEALYAELAMPSTQQEGQDVDAA